MYLRDEGCCNLTTNLNCDRVELELRFYKEECMEDIRKRLNLGNEWTININGNKGKYVYYSFKHENGAETKLIISSSKFRYIEERERVRKELEKAMLTQKGYMDYEYFEFFSDAGSLAVGDENFHINIPNGYGDGRFICRVYDENIDLDDFKKGWKFYTTVSGDFYLFSYDCNNDIGRKAEIEKDAAMKLSGRYAIYTRGVNDEYECGVAFVKW